MRKEFQKHLPRYFWIIINLVLISLGLAGCDSPLADGSDRPDEAERVRDVSLPVADFVPMAGEDWETSTPEEHGVDPESIAEFYEDADELDTLYSLLVVKDGFLITEQYFNGGSVDEKTLIQSASKSYISALVGIAVE